MRTSRLEAFGDGVFAIAATLLVLELRVDDHPADLARALVALWPHYATYVVSFLTIGIMWVNHHVLLDHVRRADRVFLYLNVLLLMTIAIVPFPTALAGEYILTDQATPALVAYGIGGLLIAVAFSAVFLYATQGERCVDRAAAVDLRLRGRWFPIGLAAYLAGVALAFIEPKFSLLLYAGTAVFYIFPILPVPRR